MLSNSIYDNKLKKSLKKLKQSTRKLNPNMQEQSESQIYINEYHPNTDCDNILLSLLDTFFTSILVKLCVKSNIVIYVPSFSR